MNKNEKSRYQICGTQLKQWIEIILCNQMLILDNKKTSKINDLTFHPKDLEEKKRADKPKVSRRNKILKVRAEINEVENINKFLKTSMELNLILWKPIKFW